MRRLTVLILAVLLPTVPGAPAWAAVIRSAVPVTTPTSAIPGLQLTIPQAGSGTLGGNPLQNSGITLQGSLPSLSGPQALISAAQGTPRTAAAASVAAGAAIRSGAAGVAGAQALAVPEETRGLTSSSMKNMQAASVLSGQSLRQESPDASYGTSRTAFERLIGAGAALGDQISGRENPVPAAPSTLKGRLLPGSRGQAAGPYAIRIKAPFVAETGTPEQAPDTKRILRWYLGGTAAFKLGMEALGMSIPMLALSVFGQAKWVALMSVGWGLSQLVFSSFAGGILDRHSPTKVISRAMGLQAAAVMAMIGLFAFDKFFPALLGVPLAHPIALLILYSMAGACLGIQDTARQVIPPTVIGKDEKAIKLFNARTHMAYEVAGVAGAILAGLVIAKFGLLAALLVHPPAYLLAAWIFSRIRMTPTGKPAPQTAADAASEPADIGLGAPAAQGRLAKLLRPVRAYISDLWAGARTVFGTKIFRWGMFALVVPVMIHRVLEGLLIPVAAKSLLGDPSAMAWIVGASNLGELIGAGLLTRALTNPNGKEFPTAFWVRIMSLGLLGIWAFTLTDHMWIILPLMVFKSASWAASDLSLRSKLQNAFPDSVRGRAFGFLSTVSFALILATTLGLGVLFDAAAHASVYLGFNVALTVMAAALFFSAKFLRSKPGETPPVPPQVKDSK